MIAGLYYTTLEKLAAPAHLEISQDALGMTFRMQYGNHAVRYTLSHFDIFNAKTNEQLVKLVENKIIELRGTLITNTQ